MHPHDGAWRAWLDDEALLPVRQQLDRHLAKCEDCRRRVEALRATRDRVAGLLSALTVPVPERRVEAVLVRAGHRPSRRWMLLAASVTAVVVTAASATIPGGLVDRLTAMLHRARTASPPPAARDTAMAPDTALPNSVSTVPADSFAIEFRDPAPEGSALVIRMEDGPVLTIVATAAVEYAVGRDRITVSGMSRPAAFTLVLPRRSPRVVVRVAGAVVFTKTGSTISTMAQPDSTGAYGLSLHQPERNPQ